MRATAADAAVAWYVCLSVCVAYTHALYTTREPILSRLFLGVGLDATETLYPWRPTPYDGRDASFCQITLDAFFILSVLFAVLYGYTVLLPWILHVDFTRAVAAQPRSTIAATGCTLVNCSL